MISFPIGMHDLQSPILDHNLPNCPYRGFNVWSTRIPWLNHSHDGLGINLPYEVTEAKIPCTHKSSENSPTARQQLQRQSQHYEQQIHQTIARCSSRKAHLLLLPCQDCHMNPPSASSLIHPWGGKSHLTHLRTLGSFANWLCLAFIFTQYAADSTFFRLFFSQKKKESAMLLCLNNKRFVSLVNWWEKQSNLFGAMLIRKPDNLWDSTAYDFVLDFKPGQK